MRCILKHFPTLDRPYRASTQAPETGRNGISGDYLLRQDISKRVKDTIGSLEDPWCHQSSYVNKRVQVCTFLVIVPVFSSLQQVFIQIKKSKL